MARLKQISIPLTNYNIVTGTNDTLYIATGPLGGGGPYVSNAISIRAGRYTINDLYEAITESMRGTVVIPVFPDTSMEYQAYSGKSKLVGDGTVGSGNIKIDIASTLATQLGFSADQIDDEFQIIN